MNKSEEFFTMLNDNKVWIDSRQNVHFIMLEDDDDLHINHHQMKTVWDSEIQPLTDFQRLVFLIATITLVSLAVFGNMLVLFVIISRF